MSTNMNGLMFQGLLENGLRNLTAHKDLINSLNVFPVPDGDTGTNMMLTLQSGLSASETEELLSEKARAFSGAVVFGARGNSGVILSQFLRGFCEKLFDLEAATPADISSALEFGVELAYKAVSNPVEGTMLTVLRESAKKVSRELALEKISDIGELFDCLLAEAKESLARTPDLLPILASAKVVDSGGEGIVRIFAGCVKFISGEKIETADASAEISAPAQKIDYSRFSPESRFEFGYCTELLLQFTNNKEPFIAEDFNIALESLGDSIVTAEQDGKLKVHVHSFTPEKVLALCHRYGEFLSMKIENMSVQHDNLPAGAPAQTELLREGPFAVVAVAHTPAMAEHFSLFGADIILRAERGCPPSASDFISAFKRVKAPIILVFPNSKNAIPVAMQAGSLTENSRVAVFPTTSDTVCYSALPMLDFEEEDYDTLCEAVSETVENLVTVTVTKASRSVTLNGMDVCEGDYAAMCGSKLLGVGKTPAAAAANAAQNTDEEYSVVRIFADASVSEEDLEELSAAAMRGDPLIETEIIPANDSLCPLTLSFE